MKNDYYVYFHKRNDTGELFYVGKGSSDRHLQKGGRNLYWQRIVNKAGGFRSHIVDENLTEERAFELEVHYINIFKSLGYNLANIKDGGEGGAQAEETKKKISISLVGRAFTQQRRLNISESKKGVPWTQTQRDILTGRTPWNKGTGKPLPQCQECDKQLKKSTALRCKSCATREQWKNNPKR